MSEDKPIEEVEKELWQRVAQGEGSERADAYVALSRIAYEKGKFKDSLAMCETAREIFEQEKVNDYPRELFDVNVGISKNYEELGKRYEAAEALGKAIEAARIIELEALDDLLRDQGRHWYSVSEYEKSLTCHQEAMEISGLDLRDSSAGIDYLNIGMCYKQLEQYSEAIEVIRNAREIFKEAQDRQWMVTCDEELTEVYVALANPVEIEYYGRRALDFQTTIQNHRHMWWLKYYIGIAHRLLGEDDEAIDLFEDAKGLALAMGYQEWEFLVKVDKEMAEMLIIKGRVAEANEILRRIKSVEEIIESETVHDAA